MENMTKKEIEIILARACGSREAFKRLMNTAYGYDRLTPEQKALVHPLRKLYREENDYMAKAVRYALRNYEINYDHLIKHFKL